MRVIWTFPLTFVAGVHGFALFVPYLIFIAIVSMAARGWQGRDARRRTISQFIQRARFSPHARPDGSPA